MVGISLTPDRLYLMYCSVVRRAPRVASTSFQARKSAPSRLRANARKLGRGAEADDDADEDEDDEYGRQPHSDTDDTAAPLRTNRLPSSASKKPPPRQTKSFTSLRQLAPPTAARAKKSTASSSSSSAFTPMDVSQQNATLKEKNRSVSVVGGSSGSSSSRPYQLKHAKSLDEIGTQRPSTSMRSSSVGTLASAVKLKQQQQQQPQPQRIARKASAPAPTTTTNSFVRFPHIKYDTATTTGVPVTSPLLSASPPSTEEDVVIVQQYHQHQKNNSSAREDAPESSSSWTQCGLAPIRLPSASASHRKRTENTYTPSAAAISSSLFTSARSKSTPVNRK